MPNIKNQIEALIQRLLVLHQAAEVASRQSETQRLLALEEQRAAALEEIHVVLEELHHQNRELAVAREAVEEERRRYQGLFECAPDGYLVTDVHGIIREANRAAARLLNVPQPHLTGSPLLLFLAKDERKSFYARLRQLLEANQGEEWEVWLQPRGGAPVAAGLTLSALPIGAAPEAAGQVVGVLWLMRNITERKSTEEALHRAKEAAETAEQTKSEFLATMSHELRTPLTVILGYTDMLIGGALGDLLAQQMDVLRQIERNSRVLFELISMVLDLNRLEAGRLPIDVKLVEVREFLNEIKGEMQGLCDQSGLTCGWQVAPGLRPLYTDPGKLKVVLKNLISNAVKFTEKGSITVAAEERQGGIEFRITDTGIGIPAEAWTYIFEPFRQVDGSTARPYGSSGLGLHIVRRLLEVLGGRITVESVVGQGSTFCVWMPVGTM